MALALLNTVYDSFKVNAPIIKELPVNNADIAAVNKKAAEPSSFDGDNFRGLKGSLKKYDLSGSTLYVKGQASMDTIKDMAAVLATADRPYTVFWFAHSGRRLFPVGGRPVEAKHINGGYCMTCQPDTIVIYRAEDALRVLIHEIQHASCLDDHSRALPLIEAECEAWAEIFYSMFMAKKHGLDPEEGWRRQLSWSLAQNRRLRDKHNVLMPTAYAWRYTVGKEPVWRKYGLLWATEPVTAPNSLSLGAPEKLFSGGGV